MRLSDTVVASPRTKKAAMTISMTMQVARILDGGNPRRTRSLAGKTRQVLRALQLEVHLTKREILDLYLDRAPFGGYQAIRRDLRHGVVEGFERQLFFATEMVVDAAFFQTRGGG